MSEMTFVNLESLKEYGIALFGAVGVPAEEARHTMESLVLANLRGMSAQGVSRLPIYLKRLSQETIRKKANLIIEKEYPSTLVVDADNSMGYTVGVQVMERLIKKAKETGIAWASVRNSTHFGMAAYMTEQAIENDMIGIVFSNSPASMAPWGGRSPRLGTNPICISLPAGKLRAVTLDMATTATSRGKVIAAKERGEKTIPEGWALDPNGSPTTDVQAALDGTMIPMGGVKGYGLALMIDMLSSGLSGGTFGRHVNNLYYTEEKQGFSHSYCVIDISKFTEIELFKAHIDRMIEEIKDCPKAEGVPEIFVPGERSLKNLEKNRVQGIGLPPNTIQMLKELGETYQVPYAVKEQS